VPHGPRGLVRADCRYAETCCCCALYLTDQQPDLGAVGRLELALGKTADRRHG
jgi:hypothetical protein